MQKKQDRRVFWTGFAIEDSQTIYQLRAVGCLMLVRVVFFLRVRRPQLLWHNLLLSFHVC